ncbi:hypothetical protein XI09_10835 [Bradyrhizobium sp. CCBAU 11386]|uniref:hypothetical protein n=1 Tax=Bradyrhizobium sp. CCBAU 11386 TaxID=1630837 RepID=UPI002303D1D1|nr:hypothetical protein [Bradyrhizobium sp. CCBAU 11386]MDA9505175.1 hypothetical protein [Bradyrhizobium sp. CCBAU 11386]
MRSIQPTKSHALKACRPRPTAKRLYGVGTDDAGCFRDLGGLVKERVAAGMRYVRVAFKNVSETPRRRADHPPPSEDDTPAV